LSEHNDDSRDSQDPEDHKQNQDSHDQIQSDSNSLTCEACGLSPDRPRIRVNVRRGRTVQVVWLCEDCAALWGFSKEDSGIPFRIGDLFFPARDDEYPELQCPSCTRSLIDIRMSGQAGCPTCYTTFRQDILLLIHGYEKEIIHRGDVPKALATLRTLLKLDQEDSFS
jgi:protein-arginine kinase activator protein McsA